MRIFASQFVQRITTFGPINSFRQSETADSQFGQDGIFIITYNASQHARLRNGGEAAM